MGSRLTAWRILIAGARIRRILGAVELARRVVATCLVRGSRELGSAGPQTQSHWEACMGPSTGFRAWIAVAAAAVLSGCSGSVDVADSSDEAQDQTVIEDSPAVNDAVVGAPDSPPN